MLVIKSELMIRVLIVCDFGVGVSLSHLGIFNLEWGCSISVFSLFIKAKNISTNYTY